MAIFRGTSGQDIMHGTAGDDRILAYRGDDTLIGGDGADRLYGSRGNDCFLYFHESASDIDQVFGDVDEDRVSFGLSHETLDIVANVDAGFIRVGDVTVLQMQSIESFGESYLGSGNDSVEGGVQSDFCYGGPGNDSLVGYAGDDMLFGGSGQDFLSGGLGTDLLDGGDDDDQLSGGEDNDTLTGGAGNDSLVGDAGDDELFGGLGQDFLAGGVGRDILDGGADDDELSGGDGRDTLVGGAGADRLNGGLGKDLLRGGSGADDFVWDSPDQGGDKVRDFQSGQDRLLFDSANFGGLLFVGAENFVASRAGQAVDADDHFLYSTHTGGLFYDSDGNGPEQRVLIGHIDGGAVSAADIFMF